jgi:hypothetical protein
VDAQKDGSSFRTRNRLLAALSAVLLFLGFPDRNSPELVYHRALAEIEQLPSIQYRDYAKFCADMLQLEKADDRIIAKKVRDKIEGELKYSTIASDFRFGYVYICPFHKSEPNIKALINELDTLHVRFTRLGPPYDVDFISKLLTDYDEGEMQWRKQKILDARQVGMRFGGVAPPFIKPVFKEVWVSIKEPKERMQLEDFRATALVFDEKPAKLSHFMLRIQFSDDFSYDFSSSHWVDGDLKEDNLSSWSITAMFPTLFYNARYLDDPERRFKQTWSETGLTFPDVRKVINLVGDLQPESAATVLREKIAGADRQLEFLGFKFSERYAIYLGPSALALLTLLFWIDAKKASAKDLAASAEDIFSPLGDQAVIVTILVANVLLPMSALALFFYRNWVIDGLSSRTVTLLIGLLIVGALSLSGFRKVYQKT